MSEILKTTANKQQYASPDAGNLMASVKKVVVTICPRSLLVSGYGDSGEVLAMRYADYNNVPTDWIIDFFEHQFLNEPLLNDPNRVTAAFIGSEKAMVIPAALHNAETAEQWLSKVQFVENDDVVTSQPLGNDKAQYVFAWPLMIKDLLKRYFPKAKAYPLAQYQFSKNNSKTATVDCCITAQEAFITVHSAKGTLLWHEVSKYGLAEDIAYRVQSICTQQHLVDYTVRGTSLNSELVIVLHKMSPYFERLQVGDSQSYLNSSGWDACSYLSKQLYQCV
ncbi:MAG: DUF3822 family protein [Sphingobacteriales bacterium]|nr:MAG: DUF3822 family protein [Sphingobacteriales bacterium]